MFDEAPTGVVTGSDDLTDLGSRIVSCAFSTVAIATDDRIGPPHDPSDSPIDGRVAERTAFTG